MRMAQILVKSITPLSRTYGGRLFTYHQHLCCLASCLKQAHLHFSSSKEEVFCVTKRGVKADTKASKAVAKPSKKSGGGEVTIGAKVAQAGKDVTYTGILIVGFAITGGLFYFIGRELFSGQSPSGIYSRSFKLCKNNEQVQDRLGMPIKAYGETTSRGRRRHTRHTEYEVDGVKHMRMKFYLAGSVASATVHLEAKQNERGKYEYRYLFVELDEYPHTTIIIEDNR